MAQVNIIQHAEIVLSNGQPLRIGSKTVPSVVTLTGTGEVVHRVWNGLTAADYTDLYSDTLGGILSGIKWWAVRSSVDAMFVYSGGTATSTSTSSLLANVWCFFGEGVTTSSAAGLSARAAEAEIDVTDMGIYIPGAVAGDVDLVVVY